MRAMPALMAAALLLGAAPAHAAMYKCKTQAGQMILSDKPCRQDMIGSKENLKIVTPPPEPAKPPETSFDPGLLPATAAERKVKKPAPDSVKVRDSVEDAGERESPSERAQRESIKRTEAAERQSEQ